MPTAPPKSIRTDPAAAGSQFEASRLWLKTATVLGVFSLVLCAGMIFDHLRTQPEDLLKSPQLTLLKDTLANSPKDDALKERIRALDLEVRRRYFHQVFLNGSGAWLLLFGLLGFVLASKQALQYRRQLPMPQPNPDAAEKMARSARHARWSVLFVGGLMGVGLLWLGFNSRSVLPRQPGDVDTLLSRRGAGGPAAGSDFAPAEQMQQNWPQFRGAGGSGLSTLTNTVLAWDIKTGTNVAWKAEVPREGFNSPIVWRDRVFLSGADAKKREVFCFDTKRGELLWRRGVENVPGSPAQPPDIPEGTGYAASSMATDGRRVYAIFATGDLAAFGFDGKQAWAKNLGVPKNPHGHASSLMTWEGRLIIQFDQGEAEQNLSRLYCLDGATGRIIWQRNRPVPASWASPIGIQTAGNAQIITLAVPWVIGYAAKDGTELWRAEGLANEVTPSPIFAGGLVLAISPTDKLMAIRPDGQGDVTKTHLAWSAEDNIPDITSPVSNGELVFTVSTPGMLTCYDAKDGKKIWEQDLAMECQASPSIIGDRLLVVGTKGVVVVAEAKRAFKEIARSELDEKVYASPAVVQNRLFLRGVKHLFCITATPEAKP